MDVYRRMFSIRELSDQRDVTMDIDLVPGVYTFKVNADGREGVVKVVVE